MTAAVRIRDLRYRYRGGDADVLRLGTLEIDGPGLVAVVGRTGVGKTTLMELLAGTLREPYQGSMQVLGVELRTLRRDADRQRHLRRVGLIPQDFGLLPGASVRDILHQDLVDAEVPAVDHAERVVAALDRVGMLAFAGRDSEQLSGGQRQRVAIARTLARDVDLVIADEPTANLDPAQAESIVALFEEIAAARPVIIVTHDMSLAARCGRIVVLRPLIHGTPPAAAPVNAAERAPRRHRLGAAGGLLLLAAATVGSSLAVRATNAHRSSPHPATVVARAGGGASRASSAPEPAVAAPVPTPAAVPGVPVVTPRQPEPQVVQVIQVVNHTLPGGPPPTAPALGATPPPVAAAPPTASSPTPAPRAIAPYVQIANQRYAVCTGGDCGGSFVHEPDWSPGVPSYYDAAGSIIGNRHGIAAGVEVDLWSGTALTRYQVLGSVIVENWGRPGPTTPPAGTALQLAGIDQANVCSDPRCTAPYFTTYVFLAALG